MSVNPGFSGQSFVPETVEKIKAVRQLFDSINPAGLIEVDGGITAETLPLVQAAGADICVAATAIFKYPDGIAAGIRTLRGAELK